MCKICRLFLTFSKLMTFLIISYFAPHVTLFNMVQTSVHGYCDGHSPFCNYFFLLYFTGLNRYLDKFFKVVYSLLKKYFCMNVLCYKESLGECGDKNKKKESNSVVEISCDVTECIFCMCMCRLMGFIATSEDINMNSWTSTDVTDFTRDVTKIIIYRYDSPWRFM